MSIIRDKTIDFELLLNNPEEKTNAIMPYTIPEAPMWNVFSLPNNQTRVPVNIQIIVKAALATLL